MKACSECKGKGTIIGFGKLQYVGDARRDPAVASFNMPRTCPVCEGDGREAPYVCPTCLRSTAGNISRYLYLAKGWRCKHCELEAYAKTI